MSIMSIIRLATGPRLTFRLTMFIMPVTWLATGTRLTFRLTMFIMQEDSAEVSGDSEKFKIRNKRKGHKRG
jgi:hypothetical protein